MSHRADADGRVILERKIETDSAITFAVAIDGHFAGDASFVRWYEPRARIFDDYGALWAGPDLCVIDMRSRGMQCIEREDETFDVHRHEGNWCIHGELSVELFDPATRATVATYSHHEVILESWWDGDLFWIRDFDDRTICLDPRDGLRVVVR